MKADLELIRSGAGPDETRSEGSAVGLDVLYVMKSDLFRLALLMMKVDLFTFGGGFASLPLMLDEIVHVRGWMDSKNNAK
jgi:hypothetical protein